MTKSKIVEKNKSFNIHSCIIMTSIKFDIYLSVTVSLEMVECVSHSQLLGSTFPLRASAEKMINPVSLMFKRLNLSAKYRRHF